MWQLQLLNDSASGNRFPNNQNLTAQEVGSKFSYKTDKVQIRKDTAGEKI